MRDIFITREVYGFTCLRCTHTWQEEYEVRHGRDGTGEEFIAYRINGTPVSAPASRCCPVCGGYRIRLTPQHRCAAEIPEGTEVLTGDAAS